MFFFNKAFIVKKAKMDGLLRSMMKQKYRDFVIRVSGIMTKNLIKRTAIPVPVPMKMLPKMFSKMFQKMFQKISTSMPFNIIYISFIYHLYIIYISFIYVIIYQ